MKMRNVKRWLSSLLCVAMLFSTLSVFGAVPKAKAWATDGKYTWPITTQNRVTAGWYYGNGNWHGATDFQAAIGTQVVAIAAGKVISAVDNGCGGSHIGGSPACPYGKSCKAANIGYANYIMIEHYDGTYSVYGHLKTGSFKVHEGDVVQQGTPIAQTGAAGKATGPHLHLEIRTGGPKKAVISDAARKPYSVDPQQYLTKKYICTTEPQPDPNRDELGCTTAYAGWYQETGSGGANVNSRHSKNWGDMVGVLKKGEYVYVSKATGTGSGNLGHILYNGVERYIAMGLFKRVNDRTGDPFGALDGCIPEEGGFRLIGWALDWDAPYTALQINVYLDGQLVLQGKADAQRTDLNQNIAGDIGDYHGYNLWIPTDKTGEHSYSVYAINEGAGSHVCIKEGTVNLPVRDKDGPVISDVKVTNVTNKGYDVSCKVTDPSGVERVMFPTWTTANGQDDLLRDWNTNAKARGTQNGDTWTFHVDIADHNNEGGEYCTDIHAYDKYGNASSLGAPRISVDIEVPVISDVKVSNITTEGYDVSCTVTDNVGVNRVVFPTWTVLNGQDDLAASWWDVDHTATRGTRNGDTWTFHVNIADHNNERGAYLTHIYAYDDAGNCSGVGSEIGQIIVPEPYPAITFDACGGRAEFTEKQLERNADGMHYGALPEAWMDGYVFDGWYTDAVDGTRVSRTTAYTAEGNTTLYAHWTPVADDAEQGWSLQDGTLVITAQGAMQDYDAAAQTPWFKDRAEIRKIVVQQGVTTIGDYAFYGCENVTSVTLPDTVTQIGKLAFYGCKALRTLTVPDSVLTVENYAFAQAGLQSIVFRGSAPVLGAGIFAGLNAEVRYPTAAAGWTEEVRQSYTGSVNWLGVGAAALAAEESELQLEDPVLAALLADSCV